MRSTFVHLGLAVLLAFSVRAAGVGPLSIQQGGGNVTVAWSGGGQLQSATALEGSPSWGNVAGSSPVTVSAGGTKQFFRVLAGDGSCSPNIVGYVNLSLPANYSLIANPLNGTNNLLSTILPVVTDGTSIERFNVGTQTFEDPITWIDGFGWTPTDPVIAPGEGFFIMPPGPLNITFIGEVPQGSLTNALPANHSYQSSMAPLQGLLTTTLGLLMEDFDTVLLWNTTLQSYDSYTYFFGMWDIEPFLPVATGFWLQKSGAASTWVQNINLSTCPAVTITLQPQSQALTLGDRAVFGVTAAGSGPLTYQWSKNGAVIPGATNSVLMIHPVAFTDAANYTVQVTDNVGTVSSSVAGLAVNSPQGGSVDFSFDPGSAANGIVSSVAVQRDGKILIGGLFTTVNGAARNRIARLNPDGTTDFTFGHALAGADNTVNSVAVQGDGKVVIGGDFTSVNGTARVRVARLNTDGSLDTNFLSGLAGASGTILAVAWQTNGQVLIGGNFTNVNGTARARLARLNSDGSLDTNFLSGLAGVNATVQAIAVDDNGRVLIGGAFATVNGTTRTRLARLHSDGALDTNFLSGLAGADNTVFSVAMQGDGQVLVGGQFTNFNGLVRGRVTRLNPDGTVDTGFMNSLPGADNTVRSVVWQTNGQVLIGGIFFNVNGAARTRIARLNSDGTLDALFQNGLAGADSTVFSLARQDDGQVVVGGQFTTMNGEARARIARLNDDGTLETGFVNGLAGANNMVNSVAVQTNGQVLIAGTFTNVSGVARGRVARLNADGSLDATFMAGLAGVDGPVQSVALQSDGLVLIGGNFNNVNGTARTRLARLNADGTLDTGFLNGLSGANGVVNAVAVETGGQVLIGGLFTDVNGTARGRIARLNTDGTLDTGFQNGLAGADGSVFAVVAQDNGQVLIGGSFSNVNGTARLRLARLESDGTLDATFMNGLPGANNTVNAMAAQTNGQVLIGGAFTNVNGAARGRLARLFSDGTLDSNFLSGAVGASAVVQSLALQRDGRVLIGGGFTNVNGQARGRLARLNSDGTLDSSFQAGLAGANANVLSVVAPTNGPVVIGGMFSSVNGVPRSSVARLLDSGGDADLVALALSTGTLAPAFDSGTITYSTMVNAPDMTVTPTSSDSNAVIQVQINGGGFVTVTSGQPSSALPLNNGTNYIDVLVTSADTMQIKIYTVMVLVTPMPEINLLGNSVNITDGDITPAFADHTDFGGVLVSGGTVVRTFTIQNSGTVDLNLTGVPKVVVGGPDAAEFAVTLLPGSPVVNGGPATFQITFNPAASGLRRATVSIDSDDLDENPFDFAIQGTGTVPEINLTGNGATIADGDTTPALADHTDFGGVTATNGTVVRTFTIQNSGTANLNLTGVPRVNVGGAHAADFTVTVQPAALVTAAGSATFQVTFDPSALGLRTATLTIESDDSDESPYTFQIQGTGTRGVVTNVVNLPAGFSLIANPLYNETPSFPEPVDGMSLQKWDVTSQTFTPFYLYDTGFGGWVDQGFSPTTAPTLALGEGALVFMPTPSVLNFTGQQITPSLPVALQPGWNLLGAQAPISGGYAEIVGPPQDGSAIYRWNRVNPLTNFASQGPLVSYFRGGGWNDSPPPVLGVAEAGFFSYTAPVVITAPPVGVTNLPPGQSATFTAGVSGSPPFYFQWQLNGQNVPGATNATYFIPAVSAGHCGTYTVSVGNGVGDVVSDPVSLTMDVPAYSLTDSFAAQGTVTDLSRLLSSHNFNATREPGEPMHGGKRVGASVWLTWQAPPSNGIVAMSLAGSGFDTMLAIYTGDSVSNLTLIEANDDDAGYAGALSLFNVRSNVAYRVCVSGLGDGTGNLLLGWNFEGTAAGGLAGGRPKSLGNPLPEFATPPQDVTVALGDPAQFSVEVTNMTVAYQWYRDGVELLSETSSSLSIASATLADLGHYFVRVTNAGRFRDSAVVTLQIETPQPGTPISGARAVDKLFDVQAEEAGGGGGLRGPRPKFIVAAHGFSGGLNITTARHVKDPGEPNHCGITGGASTWYVVPAASNGTMYVNSDLSEFDTVLAAYAGPPPALLTSYSQLSCVASNNNGGADGLDSRMNFAAKRGTNYYVALDGVNAAFGPARIAFQLVRPLVITNLVHTTNLAGGTVTMTVFCTPDIKVTNTVQYATNLVSPNWITLTNYRTTQTSFEFTNHHSGPGTNRFYRVVNTF